MRCSRMRKGTSRSCAGPEQRQCHPGAPGISMICGVSCPGPVLSTGQDLFTRVDRSVQAPQNRAASPPRKPPRGVVPTPGIKWRPARGCAQLARLRQQRGEVVPHRRIQHGSLRPPPPVLLPIRPHQPLPSYTSPGHTLPPGSHKTPPGPLWECQAAGSIPAASTFLRRAYGWLAASSIRVARMSHAGADGRSRTPTASLRVSGLRWA